MSVGVEAEIKRLAHEYYDGDIKGKSSYGNTLLHRVCYKYLNTNDRHGVVIALLEKYHLDPNASNNRACTPLHYVARDCLIECMQVLINHGARVDAKDSDGDSPLHWAAASKAIPCVEMLLRHDANPQLKNNKGNTPFEYASKHNLTRSIECLQKYN